MKKKLPALVETTRDRAAAAVKTPPPGTQEGPSEYAVQGPRIRSGAPGSNASISCHCLSSEMKTAL